MADPHQVVSLRAVAEADAAQASAAARRSAKARAREQSLTVQLNSERAAALGRAGRKIEQALQELAASEAALDAAPADQLDAAWRAYDAARHAAEQALWEMLVHREAIGMRDHRDMAATWPLPPLRRRG